MMETLCLIGFQIISIYLTFMNLEKMGTFIPSPLMILTTIWIGIIQGPLLEESFLDMY